MGLRLPRARRRWRALAAGLVFLTTLAGTIRGTADDFPFGPFSQFSGTFPATGAYRALKLEGRSTGGREFGIAFGALGLRRAEVEGQINKLKRDPEVVLEQLAAAYDRFHTGEPRLEALRLVSRVYSVEGGDLAGTGAETVATWARSSP